MRKILLSILFLSAVLFVVGCKNSEDDSAATDTPTRTPSIASFQPKGTISGLIVDRITRVPVGNAVISVGFDGEAWTTTSNAYGVFSFANVPAGQYRMVNGNAVATGTYTMTVSLVDYNAAKKDSSQKYRNYYYSTVTITFTSISQGDSVPVGGMVGNVVVNVSHLNTTLNGSVVDQDQQPVANALVTLYDATVIPNVALGQTRTDSAGAYHFTNIDNGLTVDLTAESADGSLEGSFPGTFTLPANVMTDSLRMQVNAEVLRLAPVDNVAPKVIAISPKENEDVAATFTITIDFSEPIKQTPYTRTDLALGHNTIMDDLKLTFTGLKKTNGDLTFSAQWQNNNRTLLITPQGITGASKYTFDMTAASNSGKLTDIAKNALVNNAALTGDFEALQFTTNGNSTAPAAPVLVRRMVKNNFSDLNYTGGTVGLQWNFDANVRSYNLYRSIGNEPFELIQKNIYNTQFSTNTGSLVIPAGANDPLKAVSVNYIVKAVSKDLIESNPSNTITVSDAVAPKLNGVTVTNLGSGAYLLSLAFNEPLIISSAENISNYSFQNKDTVSVTITKSDYLGFSGGAYKVQLAVTSNPEILPQGYTLTVASAVVDLNGNAIDTAANKFVTVPAKTTLLLPQDTQNGVSEKPTLTWKASNGATSYRLQISTNNTFTALVKDTTDITGLSATFPTGLSNNTLYYWRVSGVNGAGNGAFSNTASFTTIGIPTLQTPANAAINVAVNPTFTWNAAAGATSYSIEISTDPSFTTLSPQSQTNVQATNYTVGSNLAAATVYYWRVKAVNSVTGASKTSGTFSFTTN